MESSSRMYSTDEIKQSIRLAKDRAAIDCESDASTKCNSPPINNNVMRLSAFLKQYTSLIR